MTNGRGLEACALLRDGLGVEDIALRLGVPVASVRFLVRGLRARGELRAVIFGRQPGLTR